MRRSTLALLLPLASCGEAQADVYAVVGDFLDRAVPVSCERVLADSAFAVTEIRSASDTTWLLLDAPQRRILELDHDLRTVWSLAYPPVGPRSLAAPVSAAVLGDTAIAVADRGRLRVVVLSRAGEPLRSTPLGFLPNALATTASGDVLITPLPMGGRPGTLLVRYAGDRLVELPVPLRYHEDPMLRALGNAALVEALPDGRALVLHQFMAPRGFSVTPSGEATRLAVPTPDATREQIGYVPTLPLTEDQQPRILLPAIALSVDPTTAEVYLMTRSGRTVGDVRQRAILRLDDRLGLLDAFTVDVAARGMALLPRRATALVVDDADRLYACRLPVDGARP